MMRRVAEPPDRGRWNVSVAQDEHVDGHLLMNAASPARAAFGVLNAHARYPVHGATVDVPKLSRVCEQNEDGHP